MTSMPPHTDDDAVLLPAEGCLAAGGRWILALGAAPRRCVPVMPGADVDVRQAADLPARVGAALDRLAATGTVREVVFGTEVDPLLAPSPLADALLGAAEAVVRRGVGLRLCTRGAPGRDDPWGRRLSEAAGRGGAVLEVALVSTDPTLAARYEPGAPLPARRLAAAREMAAAGVRVTGRLGPLLPWISDTTAHLEDALRAFRSAGVRHVAATYLQLDAEGMRRLRRLPPAHRALLRGCLRSAPRHATEAHLLPRDLRARGHARLARIAARFGIGVMACAEANPDLSGAGTCQGGRDAAVSAPRIANARTVRPVAPAGRPPRGARVGRARTPSSQLALF